MASPLTFSARGQVFFGNRIVRAAERPTLARSAVKVTASFTVRPYTVRQGDTLTSIAKKRDIQLDDLAHLNTGLKADELKAGQTILLPANKLSSRDKEILSGIGNKTYRVYPVRDGETLTDIISKRGITRQEMEALNPGVKLDKLPSNVVLKLPPGKYTVREREMLTGSGVLPVEFFKTGDGLSKGIAGAILLGIVYFVFMWRYKQTEEKDDSDE